MTAAAQKEIFRQALALPKKARLDLYKRLCKSLEVSKGTKSRALLGAQAMAESTAVYGRKKTVVRSKDANLKSEVLSKEEWDEEWKSELEKRIADVESGKVKCIPYAEVRKKLDRILGRA
jgi:hypothetical protein